VSDIKAELSQYPEDSETYGMEASSFEQLPLGEMNGVIKSWNGAKGFGFITSDHVDGDVFFSKQELPAEARECHGSVLEGREVSINTSTGRDGRARATTVNLLPTEGKPLLGSIKSYSERHRYGFITSSGLTEDARFQATDLPPGLGMMGPNLKGQFVTFEVQRLPDGKIRVTKMQLQGQTGANMNPATQRAGSPFANSPVLASLLQGMGAMVPMQPARIQPWSAAQQPRQPARPPSTQMSASASDGSAMDGMVKSYSEKNGYGFIQAPGQAGDLRFAKQDLNAAGVSPGTPVTFVPHITPDGRMQARQVNLSDGRGTKRASAADSFDSFGFMDNRPKKQARVGGTGMSWNDVAGGGGGGGGGGGHSAHSVHAADLPGDGQRCSGVVKSFIPPKGFGFITSDQCPGDIYFARAVMPADMHYMELQGQAVTFELARASDGKLRARSVALA